MAAIERGAQNFGSGPAANQFCWDRQPEWSVLQDGSFGHGVLEVTREFNLLIDRSLLFFSLGEEQYPCPVDVVPQPRCVW
ncbi:hypothetical protein SELMODRAFT_95188 [Selaginella moellendorffii]|uniref:Uncharacterized protein n=1 Tax=Selaginella moellendorffii TaxID=88036 RepID=D8RJH3_SELML|nr:hypothetical protein SELMODRAFT_95188 [Selaginella moellendorffii]